MREFNVTGTCIPERHYMVDTTTKLEKIKVMIDRGNYFTINRGRQYGKTTTFFLLKKFLPSEYTVVSISFEGIGDTPFENEKNFCVTFLRLISKALRFTKESSDYRESWISPAVTNFNELSEHITNLCEGK